MYIETKQIKHEYQRKSKLGTTHVYYRTFRLAVLRCDNCGEIFERPKSKIDPKRLSNSYFHCCPNCDTKRFAQKKGAERKVIWDRPASSSDDISRL